VKDHINGKTKNNILDHIPLQQNSVVEQQLPSLQRGPEHKSAAKLLSLMALVVGLTFEVRQWQSILSRAREWQRGGRPL
jgi:hypothetical protein